ncbi:uncharacterized protein C2845_PM01G13510 [Panicum miliaceum]|uniref:SAM domain-containing protein n=1 Tax=Panicum miliaceum TaxID=4540 RepID=A0A3L6TNY7_PANMI|nr:uncharacterized protein C2845_PM01G13510 [Panicum miliaceum]
MGLEPALVYEYALVFARNELEAGDMAFLDHKLLHSMGISVAKHRLEILKLAWRDRRSPHRSWPAASSAASRGACARSCAAGRAAPRRSCWSRASSNPTTPATRLRASRSLGSSAAARRKGEQHPSPKDPRPRPP